MKIPAPSFSRRQFVVQFAAGATALVLAPSVLRAGAGNPPAPLPSKKLGVALLGLGSYAKGELAPALQRTQHCQLMGVVTGKPDTKGKQWAQQYGFPEKNIYSYDTMEGLKDNPDIDIVYVVTPNSLHRRDTLAAAKAGKHVISEKPMSVSVAECDLMIQACRDAGVQLGIGYRNNFDPSFQEMMRIARWKEMGAIKGMTGEYSGNFNAAGAWRTKKEFAGGGPVMDLGVYVIHASLLAAGGESPVAVTARSTTGTKPTLYVDVEETMEFTLEFANGAKCEGYTSYLGTRPGGPGGNRFHVDYERGFVDFPQAFNYSGVRATTSNGPLNFADIITPRDGTYGQARHMDDFARCVRDRMPTSVPGQMGRQDLCVIEAIYASAQNNGARTPVRT